MTSDGKTQELKKPRINDLYKLFYLSPAFNHEI